MKNEGWISLHRSIQSHWIWQDANKFQWWVDILLTVNQEHSKVALGYELFDCGRGQSLLSIQSWASRWSVSKDTARNFLNLLEKDKMILRENVGKSTRITVCKYDSYQPCLHDNSPQSKRNTDTNNNILYINNINNIVKLLNNIGGTNFSSTGKSTVKHITARLKEGFTENDFEKVINHKVPLWKKDKKMAEYIRPETLFGSKFESYLNSVPKEIKLDPENTWTDERYEAFAKGPQQPIIQI